MMKSCQLSAISSYRVLALSCRTREIPPNTDLVVIARYNVFTES